MSKQIFFNIYWVPWEGWAQEHNKLRFTFKGFILGHGGSFVKPSLPNLDSRHHKFSSLLQHKVFDMTWDFHFFVQRTKNQDDKKEKTRWPATADGGGRSVIWQSALLASSNQGRWWDIACGRSIYFPSFTQTCFYLLVATMWNHSWNLFKTDSPLNVIWHQ